MRKPENVHHSFAWFARNGVELVDIECMYTVCPLLKATVAWAVLQNLELLSYNKLLATCLSPATIA